MTEPVWSAEHEAEFQAQVARLSRGTVEIVPEDEFKQKLRKSIQTGQPLKIKLGLDPTAPDIHLGHTVVLQKMRQFQQFGHHVQLIIGDFTGRIGDPTGKSETRKQLTEEDVKRNADTYQRQIFKILDPERTTVVFNSEWLGPMQFADVVRLAAHVTVARMLERDDFTKRYQGGMPISIHEFFYPLMQGYDSVILKSDVELGGTDQKFNLLMGRTLQKEYGIPTQATMMLPLLEGLDGVNKMSKSLGNYIGIDEAPQEMYGKAMSIPDELMGKYAELITDWTLDELAGFASGVADGSLHPRDAKMNLARTIVRMYHGAGAADEAQQHFVTVFQQRAMPDEIEEKVIVAASLGEQGTVKIAPWLVGLGLAASTSEARRAVQQGGVKLNGEKIADPNAEITVEDGLVVQIGRRKFVKIKIEQ